MTIRSAPPGPPQRIDGYTIGAIPTIQGPGPHGGEVHPDGDEFLYLVSGAMEFILDDGDEGRSASSPRSCCGQGTHGSCHAASGTGSKRSSPVTWSMSHLARTGAIDR